jgi:hypothetical protein
MGLNGRSVAVECGLGAYIQRRGAILAWIVILSVYGADPNAEVIGPHF